MKDLISEEERNLYFQEHSKTAQSHFFKKSVAVIGEVKSGKSSLFNSLLGEKVCPVDSSALTCAVCTYFYRSKEELKGKVAHLIKKRVEDVQNKNEDNTCTLQTLIHTKHIHLISYNHSFLQTHIHSVFIKSGNRRS